MTLLLATLKPSDPKRWRYIVEIDYRFEHREADVSVRDWDVTDEAAREAAAREELGDDVDAALAQWFICPDDNTAGLCVYRTRPASSR